MISKIFIYYLYGAYAHAFNAEVCRGESINPNAEYFRERIW